MAAHEGQKDGFRQNVFFQTQKHILFVLVQPKEGGEVLLSPCRRGCFQTERPGGNICISILRNSHLCRLQLIEVRLNQSLFFFSIWNKPRRNVCKLLALCVLLSLLCQRSAAVNIRRHKKALFFCVRALLFFRGSGFIWASWKAWRLEEKRRRERSPRSCQQTPDKSLREMGVNVGWLWLCSLAASGG